MRKTFLGLANFVVIISAALFILSAFQSIKSSPSMFFKYLLVALPFSIVCIYKTANDLVKDKNKLLLGGTLAFFFTPVPAGYLFLPAPLFFIACFRGGLLILLPVGLVVISILWVCIYFFLKSRNSRSSNGV